MIEAAVLVISKKWAEVIEMKKEAVNEESAASEWKFFSMEQMYDKI